MKTSKRLLALFICVAFTVVSCSTSDDALLQNDEHFLIEESSLQDSSETKVITSNRTSTWADTCTYFNANPFTGETETFGCTSPSPSPISTFAAVPCFPTMLQLHVSNDFENQILDGTTFVQELDTSFNYGSEFKFFTERGVPENACLYPYIQANHANIVFRSVSCEIQDYFDTLPTLPSNQFYYPDITFMFTDFLFSGPHADSSFVEFSLSVKIWEVN